MPKWNLQRPYKQPLRWLRILWPLVVRLPLSPLEEGLVRPVAVALLPYNPYYLTIP